MRSVLHLLKVEIFLPLLRGLAFYLCCKEFLPFCWEAFSFFCWGSFTFVERPSHPRPAFIFALFVIFFSSFICISFFTFSLARGAGRYNHMRSEHFRFKMKFWKFFCNWFVILQTQDMIGLRLEPKRIADKRCSLTFLLVLLKQFFLLLPPLCPSQSTSSYSLFFVLAFLKISLK